MTASQSTDSSAWADEGRDGLAARAPGAASPKQPLHKQRTRRAGRRNGRRPWFWLIAAAIVIAGGYAAWRVVFADSASNPLNYITSAVGFGRIEDAISSVGTLSPAESRVVESVVSGRIATLLVEIGDDVTAGDVVATIDAAGFEAALRIAQAQLTSSRATLADRELSYDLAVQNLARQEGLLAVNGTSESAVQNARAQVSSAAAQLESIRATIVQQEQNLADAQASLAATVIRAPISGKVSDLSAAVGKTVQANAQLMTIADFSTMTVEARVSEADVGRLAAGMQAYFTTLAGSGRRWTGTLRQILPTPVIESNVVLYSVLFEVDNADGELMVGMSAQAFFVVNSADGVLTVPVAALLPALPGNLGSASEGVPAERPASGAAPSLQPLNPAEMQSVPADPPLDRNEIAQRFGAAAAASDSGGQVAGTPSPGGQSPGAQIVSGIDVQGLLGSMGVQGLRGLPTTHTVRVMLEDGSIEMRTVEVGVRDRVNAEILSGLSLGERVVTSVVPSGGDAASGTGAVPMGLPGGITLSGPGGGGVPTFVAPAGGGTFMRLQ